MYGLYLGTFLPLSPKALLTFTGVKLSLNPYGFGVGVSDVLYRRQLRFAFVSDLLERQVLQYHCQYSGMIGMTFFHGFVPIVV
jgi:hypothetical protein